MDEQKKEDGGIDPTQQYEDEDDDDFDPFLHATVPRNLYHKFQTEGSKRWGPPTEILPFLFLGSCFCANEEELLRELGVDHILNVAEECPPPPTVAKKEGEKLVKHYMMVDVVEHIRKSENQWNTFEACFNFIDKARVAYEGKNGGGKKRKGSKRMKRPGKDGEEKSGERKGSGMKIRLSLRAGKEKEKEKENGCSEAAGPLSDRVLVHCMHGRSRSATIVLAYLMKKEGWTLREAYVHVKLRRPIVGPDKYLKHQLIDYEKHLFGKSSFQSVEEFRDFQVQLSPELELKEKERKQKMKEEEEALQQEQSSSNDDNATKEEASASGADADEADVEGGADCNKEMMADGEDELDGTTNINNNNHSSSNDKEEGEGEGKGSGKKKKKSKKSKKASGGEESTSDAGEKEEKKKKRKKKSKKRKEGSTTSSSSGNNSTTASPRLREGEAEQEEEDECNNRTRGGSVAAPKDEPGPATKTKKKKNPAGGVDQPSTPA